MRKKATANFASKRAHVALLHSGLSLAIAESCTGGWVTKLLTDHSGASRYLKGGVVVYSNETKRKLLGMRINDTESAARKEVAIEMARSALSIFGADIGVATTGYMDSGLELTNWLRKRKLTGIAYVAVAFRHQAKIATRCGRFFLKGTRRQNRLSSSTAALHLIVKIIQTKGAPREHFK